MGNKQIALYIIITLLLLSGCTTDSREIDQRTMILGMGIDIGENGEYIVSVQVPVIVPTENSGALSANEYETIIAKGESVWEAISQIEAYTPTVLFFGHLKAVMIGERIARQGLQDILDVLDRRAPLANQIYLLIIRESNEVSDFLEEESNLISLPSLYIDRFFHADQKVSRTGPVKLFEFRRDINMVSNAGFIPLAYSDGNIVIEDKAVIKNGKLVGQLVGKEAGVSHLLRDLQLENANYSIDLEQNGTEINVSARLKGTADMDIKKTDPVEIDLDVNLKGELVHLSEQAFRSTKDHMDEITETLENEVKKDLEHTINKMKEINVEPWLIGHQIWAKHYDHFKQLNWEETGWRDSVFHINVQVEMEQTGQRGMLEKKKLGR
ncbi:Ger(x)C family spore germination protein [Evansella cellulosilytica]|uniref:Germination protein, Ger(X)C family n=1 Tax=Evansella cellulosilytica (strain ATCC 21833 / DSM 2522 / FERM P-1141 / JCM 9156 / N-4) TaxID=649639 RepID=E6U2A2_EVAC2|nr:Ger(x)C family spore germination protein [Evansella cellulosilytica]ADU30480.1 germination protein, Ger(x)C family [Evansella cellulosilytica DSM 2522]